MNRLLESGRRNGLRTHEVKALEDEIDTLRERMHQQLHRPPVVGRPMPMRPLLSALVDETLLRLEAAEDMLGSLETDYEQIYDRLAAVVPPMPRTDIGKDPRTLSDMVDELIELHQALLADHAEMRKELGSLTTAAGKALDAWHGEAGINLDDALAALEGEM